MGLLLDGTRAHAGLAFWVGGEQVLANVQRIRDLARAFERRGGLSFRGFVDRLTAESGSLVFHTAGCRVLGIPLPRFCWPSISVRASQSETQPDSTERFAILVQLAFPMVGRIVEYSGDMQLVRASEGSGAEA